LYKNFQLNQNNNNNKKKNRVWRGTYTWHIIREGGFNGEELEGLSEVMIDSAMSQKLGEELSTVLGFLEL
jgi:hypothetical protein